jgi:hypothetical protein
VARPYGVWVSANIREFSFGVGGCQLVLFACAVGLAARRVGRDLPALALSLGILAAVIATDVIGANRGEVIRLWIFLACFSQVPLPTSAHA